MTGHGVRVTRRRGAAALGLLLAPALLAACSPSERVTPAPAPAAGPVPAGIAERCPPVAAPLRHPVDGVLPAGATLVRLCRTDADTGGGSFRPPEAVVTGVDAVVDAARAVQPAPADLACTLEGGPTFALWFGYPDGDARSVTYTAAGCRTLDVPHPMLGGEAVHDAWADALAGQRSTRTPPADAGRLPRCGDLGGGLTPLPLKALPPPVRATYCEAVPGATGTAWGSAPVPTPLLRRLGAAWSADAPPRTRCHERRVSMLVAVTAWGDRVAFSRRCTDLRGHGGRWAVGPGIAERLDALVPDVRR